MKTKKDILEQLAHSMGRRDEEPNIALAERIAASDNAEAMAELKGLIDRGTMAIRYDALKVFYEVGERKPELIFPYTDFFCSALIAQKQSRSVECHDCIVGHRP